MSLSEVIKTALDHIEHVAKTETVIGEPIKAGDITLIPVSKVSIGFAAGGGGKDDTCGSGAGTGGGVNVTPIALISVSEGNIEVHSVSQSDPSLSKLLAAAPDLWKKISKYVKKKDEIDCDD
ncbi:spore germination protein GerW family protein [Chitinispirillales bacterium ANBcel5]|uniref:GerW family sporulation protein n=1 Tax=Cellulosispirillum alkaliphilum TaxID=3039283 RepID=UPI002A4FB1E1|nr:spore germination protein GerW family protein [Chitinispirillales bacterium ANBcel5]